MSHQLSRPARLWEIDTLRGVAIIMMIIFHLMWDLWFFRVLPNVVLFEGFWKYFERTTAITFLTLVGVSLTVSYRRAQHSEPDRSRLTVKFLQRGLRVLGWGMVLTLIMRVAGVGYIDFGILHLIGVSILLAYPLLTYRWLNLALWALLYGASGYVEALTVNTRWWVWLGLMPDNYTPNDYFPLIPWLGVVLLGLFIGNSLYNDQGRTFFLPNLADNPLAKLLQWLGRHSLTIYLLHQPILFAIFFGLYFARQ